MGEPSDLYFGGPTGALRDAHLGEPLGLYSGGPMD